MNVQRDTMRDRDRRRWIRQALPPSQVTQEWQEPISAVKPPPPPPPQPRRKWNIADIIYSVLVGLEVGIIIYLLLFYQGGL